MSYILDALRRADAERQRGAVPGLHAQPVAGVLNEAATAPGAPARRLGLAAAALVLLGLALAALGWLRPGAAPGAPVAVLPAPAPATGPSPAAPAALALTPQTPTPRSPLPLPTAVPVPVPLAAAPRRAAMAAATASPPAQVAPTPAQPASAVAPVRLPSLAELPEAQRRELGPLAVGGAMHAEQAALRIIILNGQVFHEGDKPGPDLQVQQIRLKSVVMSHRGQRFELPF